MSVRPLQPSKRQAYLTVEEANEMIKKFDKNGDGVLTKEELTGILLHLAGRPAQAVNNNGSEQVAACKGKTPKANAKPAHKASSKPQTEPQNKPGAVAANPQKAPPRVPYRKASNLQLSREEMKEIFREHDMDGDGFLSVDELTRAFCFLGSVLPFYKAHYGLAHADANGDGLISDAELDKLIDYAEKTHKKK